MIIRLGILIVSCAVFTACDSGSNFSSGGSSKTNSSDQNPKYPPSTGTDTATSTTPENAITQGSFTVWTVPANPKPYEIYTIYIDVRLAPNMTDFKYADLFGSVDGTDTYHRGIGRESLGMWHAAKKKPGLPDIADQFSMTNNVAHVQISVPGAKQLIKDHIKVGSDVPGLTETQEIDIQFNK